MNWRDKHESIEIVPEEEIPPEMGLAAACRVYGRSSISNQGEIRFWLDENCIGDYIFVANLIGFENATDAMMFRMTWSDRLERTGR